MLILVGIADEDTVEDIEWLVRKCAGLRIFDDAEGVMNLDIRQVGGEVLAVSQFTLMASTKKGNRPSYIRAAAALPHLYGAARGAPRPTGRYGRLRGRHAGGTHQ